LWSAHVNRVAHQSRTRFHLFHSAATWHCGRSNRRGCFPCIIRRRKAATFTVEKNQPNARAFAVEPDRERRYQLSAIDYQLKSRQRHLSIHRRRRTSSAGSCRCPAERRISRSGNSLSHRAQRRGEIAHHGDGVAPRGSNPNALRSDQATRLLKENFKRLEIAPQLASTSRR
jgi:hypothetical protein